MKTLQTIEGRVKSVLTEDKKTRDDDMLLYLKVCNSYLKGTGEMAFAEVMIQHKFLGLPSFESVSRTRRKLQATYSDLIGSARIKQLREEQENLYREYAKE